MRNNVARSPAAHSRRVGLHRYSGIYPPPPPPPSAPPPRALALRRVRHPLLSATNLAARDSPLSPICRSLLDKGMIQQLNTKTTCRDPRILSPSLSLFVSLLFFFFFHLRHFCASKLASRGKAIDDDDVSN